MADVELLPLPEHFAHQSERVQEHVRDYARANMEPLRAEVERLRSLCAAAYQMAGVHDAPVEWLDALSNAASGRKFSIDGLLPYMPDAVCEAEARADRLAEALRKYGQHHGTCELKTAWPFSCTCGFNAALAQEDRNG